MDGCFVENDAESVCLGVVSNFHGALSEEIGVRGIKTKFRDDYTQGG
jgi:hypothetical protein